MAAIPALVKTEELDFRFIDRALRDRVLPEALFYDADVDLLTALYVSPEIETAVHFADVGDVGVLCTLDDLRVVGFHIEAFRKAYLPTLHDRETAMQLMELFTCMADTSDMVTLYPAQKARRASTFQALSQGAHDAFMDRGLHQHAVPA